MYCLIDVDPILPLPIHSVYMPIRRCVSSQLKHGESFKLLRCWSQQTSFEQLFYLRRHVLIRKRVPGVMDGWGF